MKYCGQVNIPTVNNNAIACKNYYDTDCVIYQDPIPYFGTVDPSTSTEVFDLIISSLSDARSRIVTLESAGGITFDLVPTDGSTNAVQSNGIFDALAIKLEDAPIDGSQYVRLNGAWTPIVGASNVLVGDNVAVATTPLPAYTSGTGNTAFGDRALENATTINGVVAIGDMAGFYAAATEAPTEGVTTELTINIDGIFIGAEAKPSSNGSTNEIVIGTQAFGNGSNTATFGDLRTIGTYLRGDVFIEAAGGSGALDVVGATTLNSGLTVTGNIGVSGTVDGRDVAADGTKLDGIEAGATADQLAAEVPITDVGLFFTATDVEGALQELAAASGGITDGDRGDITVSGSGAVWTIDSQAVTFGKIQSVTTGTVAGRVSSGAGSLEELSGADVTGLLSTFSTSTTTQGVVPGANGVGAGYFLEATGGWTQIIGGAGNTIYSADDALAGNRTVSLATYQLTFTDAGGDIVVNNGRLGVNTPVYGGTRLGDSFFQTPSIDTTSINIKDGALNTALAIFSSPVGTVPGDGFVTTLKNFTDSVNVISIAAQDANQVSGIRQVESTIALRNDYQDNSYTVLDMFNQDYPAAGTAVAQKMGWVAIHGGGALAKNVGFWRYNGTTYTNIWELNGSNVLTFGVAVYVPDDAYSVAWNGDTSVPTKNAIYDQIQVLTSTFITQQDIDTLAELNAIVADATLITDAPSDGNDYVRNNGAWQIVSGAVAALNDLTDVTITAPTTGEYLRYNGTNFVNYNPSGDWVPITGNVTMTGTLNVAQRLGITTGTNSFSSATSTIFTDASDRIGFKQGTVNSNTESMVFELSGITAHRVVTFPDKTGTVAFLDDVSGGATVLNDLTDVTITAAATGEYLRYNGAAWVDASITEADITDLGDYVDKTTTESIGGLKTFTSSIHAGNGQVIFSDDVTPSGYASGGALGYAGASQYYFHQDHANVNNTWGIFDFANLTAARTFTLPNITGEVLLTAGTQTISGSKTFTGTTTFGGDAGAWDLTYAANAIGFTPGDVNGVFYVTDSTSTAVLTINTNTGDTYISGSGSRLNVGAVVVTDATASTNKDTGALIVTTGGLGVEGAINAGGDITAFASSDPRLKDDMTRISNPMDLLSQLSGYNFVWNDKQDLYSGADVGLNALEVQDVIPSAVRQSSESVGGWLQVDYKKVIPVLVEAVKEKDGELKQVKEQLQLQGQELQDSKRRIQELEETVRYLLNKVG